MDLMVKVENKSLFILWVIKKNVLLRLKKQVNNKTNRKVI